MSDQVSFRRARNADLPVVQRLVDDALRAYGLGIELASLDEDLTDVEQHYHQPGGSFELLVASTGQVLGVLGWRPGLDGDGARICELKKLYLAAEARGRGLGRLALTRLVDAARAAGFVAITLETAGVLSEANRLYLRFGFVPVAGAAAGSFAALSDQCDRAYRLDLVPTAGGHQPPR